MEKKILFRNLVVGFLVIMLLVLVFIAVNYAENPTKMLYPGEIVITKAKTSRQSPMLGKTPSEEYSLSTFQITIWK